MKKIMESLRQDKTAGFGTDIQSQERLIIQQEDQLLHCDIVLSFK